MYLRPNGERALLRRKLAATRELVRQVPLTAVTANLL
jgi:hypothetical protein